MKRFCTLKNKEVDYADCIACTESNEKNPCPHIMYDEGFVIWEW